MLSFRSAGESHGPAIVALLEGFPAGFAPDLAAIDADLARRQGGFGRSSRMRLEQDRVEFVGGLVRGLTTGAPLVLRVANRDTSLAEKPPIHRPRPGHADLAGAYKYLTDDARPILERASARETCARVAAGSLCAQLLSQQRITTAAWVDGIAGVAAEIDPEDDLRKIAAARAKSRVACPDLVLSRAMEAAISAAGAAGDSVGGTFVVVADGVPPGLGSCAQWDERIDGRLGQALLSIPAVKGVELGLGFELARRRGSESHDLIRFGRRGRFGAIIRGSNRAGGIEGGMTNGERIVVRAAMKPIATLRRPLESVDLRRKSKCVAAFERADVCAVPAASVIGEAMVRLELLRAFLGKFGGDTVVELATNFKAWRRLAAHRFAKS